MSKLAYPKGRLLLVRDCTVDICLKNNPGAVLLSVLLFWYDNPHKGDWENAGLQEFCMCRTQAEIEEASCHQIDVKTIHDTAIPLLCLLGYLHVGKKMNGDLYVLHMDRVIAGFAAYEQSLKTNHPIHLKNFLHFQLESALIEMTEDELESALINKSRLYRLLERTLIRIRADSNCKRGRKTRAEAPLVTDFRNIEIIRDSIEIDTKRDSGAFAPADFLPLEDEISEEDEPPPTVHRLPAIKLNGASHATVDTTGLHSGPDRGDSPGVRGSLPDRPLEQTPGTGALPSAIEPPQFGRSHGITSDQATLSLLLDPDPAQAVIPPAAGSVASGASTAQASGKPEKPKRGRKNEVQLTLHEAEIKAWYEELRGVEISLSKRTVTALAALGKRKMSKDDFLSVTAILDSDTWFEEHKVGVDLFWINFHWENKIIFLRRKPAAPPTKKPPDPNEPELGVSGFPKFRTTRGKEMYGN